MSVDIEKVFDSVMQCVRQNRRISNVAFVEQVISTDVCLNYSVLISENAESLYDYVSCPPTVSNLLFYF